MKKNTTIPTSTRQRTQSTHSQGATTGENLAKSAAAMDIWNNDREERQMAITEAAINDLASEPDFTIDEALCNELQTPDVSVIFDTDPELAAALTLGKDDNLPRRMRSSFITDTLVYREVNFLARGYDNNHILQG